MPAKSQLSLRLLEEIALQCRYCNESVPNIIEGMFTSLNCLLSKRTVNKDDFIRQKNVILPLIESHLQTLKAAHTQLAADSARSISAIFNVYPRLHTTCNGIEVSKQLGKHYHEITNLFVDITNELIWTKYATSTRLSQNLVKRLIELLAQFKKCCNHFCKTLQIQVEFIRCQLLDGKNM